MKYISILGSTGSIGTQTLEIVRSKREEFEVCALSAARNVDLMEEQCREFMPSLAVMYVEDAAYELKKRLEGTGIEVLSGMEGLIALARLEKAQILVTGVVGMIGIQPTIAAIEAGKDIALANKETLVCAGHLIMPLAKKHGVRILPVDSEHSAIFQSLATRAVREETSAAQVEKILLTASGGPFRGKKREDLLNVTLSQVLNHPNWVMGAKVTIDSASLINKGLEVMEARWLFDMELDRIQVVVHPQSILHSAVQFTDGAIIGQMGVPDMKLPIQYALTYPEREYLGGERVDLFRLGHLDFYEPDMETFRGLGLAFEAARRGGVAPSVFNAANEEAVKLLIDGKIGFLQIPELIERAMDGIDGSDMPGVEEILDVQKRVAQYIRI